MASEKSVCIFAVIITALIFNSGCSTVRMLDAWRLERYGDPAEAVLRYHQIAENDPKSPSARKALLSAGDLYYEKLDRKPRAIEVYYTIVRDYPGTTEAFIALKKLGTHYFNAHEYQKSQEIMSKLFNDNPCGEMGTEAQWTLSQSYEKLTDYRHAASCYYAFAILHPDDKRAVDALLQAGDIYKNKLSRENKAVDVYSLAVKTYGRDNTNAGKVWAATRELKAMGAEVPRPYLESEFTELRKPIRKERTDAFADMNKKHEVKSNELGIFDSVDVDTIFRNTMSSAPGNGMGGEPGESSVDPENTMLTLANMYYMSMDYMKAGAFYHQLELRSNEDPWVYWNLGNCYGKLGLFNKAKDYHERALKMSPGIFDKALMNAEREYSIQDYPESLDILEQIEVITPINRLGRIYYDAGLAYRKMNDLDNALMNFEKSCAFDPTPENKDSAQHIAEILYYTRRDAVKAGIYQDIVEDKVRSFKVQSELAELCFKYGSYKWARIKYKFVAELASNKETELSMLVQSAIATAKYGDISLAKSELSQLKEAYGDSPVISRGFAEIEKEENKENPGNKEKDSITPPTELQIQKLKFIFNFLINGLIFLISVP